MSPRVFPGKAVGLQPSVAAGPLEGGGTDTRPEASPRRSRKRLGRRGSIALGLVGLLLVGCFAAWAWWPGKKADIRAGTTLVDADGMAARHGIDVTLIAVTAAGGLVDFRYQVVDPDKATPVIHDLALFPKLIEERTGATLAMRSLPHNHKRELEFGGTYFFLLPNAHNALHPGSRVTLVIGDARVEHLVVKG